ncbi:MAG: electron transfer flavoprotein subunit alpha/FixB family protein [Eudoraea sp.]|nr:electron transfer flavoprotein subunit alpha/FixB family protein [Eudoraea sp.]
MSVLVYTETEQGNFKKSANEVASYGSALAEKMGTTATAVAFNADDAAAIGAYGVAKVLHVSEGSFESFTAAKYAKAIAAAARQENATVVVISSSANSRYLAPLLAVELQAGYASNVIALPDDVSSFKAKRNAFTNKACAYSTITSDVKLVGVSNNAFGITEKGGSASIESFTPDSGDDGVTVEGQDKAAGKVTIADADIVVSAGRGLKGPENWEMVEELAEILGAATACSKPVSDMGWRPHSEHVGQTGKPVASNLYIAIGISGAIQHLAGINASKVKVVINTDPEAPFFKAADYGVVGDAFTVVPQLIEKLKAFKATS